MLFNALLCPFILQGRTLEASGITIIKPMFFTMLFYAFLCLIMLNYAVLCFCFLDVFVICKPYIVM